MQVKSATIREQKTKGDRLTDLVRRLPPESVLDQIAKTICERSLLEFVEQAWPYLDNGGSPFYRNWHLEAISDHLEAVSRGEIRKLVLNLPPRSLKSVICSVAWPMWSWAQTRKTALTGPQVKFLCASYNQDLSWKLSTDTRKLLTSPFYQKYWGKRIILSGDTNTKTVFENTLGGSRFATSVGGSLLGIGASIIVCDDLQNTSGLSDTERQVSTEWFKELSTTRFNDPKTGAIVVVQQRLHQLDISGYIQKYGGDGWEFVVIPMEFEPTYYQIPTSLGWIDPRALNDAGALCDQTELNERAGWLMHPERVPREEVENIKKGLGPYLASGRLQQSPVPAGGGIIKEEWWKLWEGATFPEMGTIVASLDSAYTEKEENDPSALTVWGSFSHPETGQPCMMLMDAWEKRYGLNDLVEAVALACKKHRVDTLLVEARASGISVAQELSRLYGTRQWQTLQITPKGDKVARAHTVVPFFSAGMIYAPDKDFAQIVIDQAKNFPKSEHDDLVDSATAALIWLRANGTVQTREEFAEEQRQATLFRKAQPALYDV